MAALLPSKRQQSYSKVFKADLFGLMFLIRKGQKNKPIESTSKCSMGWFFGFKLHLICNERGELLNFMVTPGDVNNAYAQPRALPWAMCHIWALHNVAALGNMSKLYRPRLHDISARPNHLPSRTAGVFKTPFLACYLIRKAKCNNRGKKIGDEACWFAPSPNDTRCVYDYLITTFLPFFT